MSRRLLLLALVVLTGCGGDEPRSPRVTPAATATATSTPEPVAGALPGAEALRTCAAAGEFWPTMTLALDGETAWVACKEEARVVSLAGAELTLERPVIAVLSAVGAVWALDDGGELYRIEGGRIVSVLDLEASRPYNLWEGAGSIWAVDDASGEIIRVDPEANQVTFRVAVGDGPSDMVFAGERAWIVNHRDRALLLFDAGTERVLRLATLKADAPERIARLGGSLWVTGRGTDLLRIDPKTGRVRDTIDIGASGIDVVAAGGALWVPSRSEAVDESGLPTMESLRRVTPDGETSVVSEASGPLDVHGLAADATHLWLSDNTAGVVYRLPLDG